MTYTCSCYEAFETREELRAHRIAQHRVPCPVCGEKSQRETSVYCTPECYEASRNLNHPIHKVLREAIRHYLEFEEYVTNPDAADVENRIDGTHGNLTFKGVTINFYDLQGALKMLSKRKKEAVFHHVIMDSKQKEVEKVMGITTVTVGQYVEQAMLQLCRNYFDLQEQSVNPPKKPKGKKT